MSRKFNTKKFIKDVLNDKYALVIGNENILDPKIEPTRDVHQYLLRMVNENSNMQYESYHDIAIDKNERINPVRRLIEDEEIQFRASDVSKELMDLLKTRLFSTVLTTTTDEYVEAAMKKVWGKNLRVVNIYDKETVDELQKTLKNCRRGKKYNQPTLIYVFGKLDVDDLAKKYIKTDADAILLIEKWMRMDVEANNEMLEFIRSKRLLALGCKYDNWYFHFFWYVLTGVTKSSEENNYDGRGEVAFPIDKDDKTDGKLLQFLNRTDICILGDATSFITNLTKTLTEDSEDAPFRKQIEDSRRRGGVFISYCSKDALTACQLFYQLCDKKMDVWLDNARIFGGDKYEGDIADAISEAKVVVTVLSPNVAEDLKTDSTSNYYNKEWRMAQQFDDKVIIPLAVNGYDLKADYHQIYKKIVNQKASGIDLTDGEGFTRLIESINEHLQSLDSTDNSILGDATSFISNISKTLTDDSEDAPFRKQVEDSCKRGGVFISYCSKDVLTACQLFYQLCDKKMDVWLDNARLFGGDKYEGVIADAIIEAKVVVTVLSPNVAEDLKNESINHYYNKEWRLAQQHDGKTIIPLAVNGYDLNADYHQVYKSIVNQEASEINLMEGGGFSKLIDSINEHL